MRGRPYSPLLLAWALPLLLGPAVGAAQSQSAPAPSSASVLERAVRSRVKGAESDDVVVFEIADFQCPYCARFAADVGPRLDEKYVQTGRVKWVFVNLPLHTHPLAWLAAEAALCAGAAGDRFWDMHDRLFAEQDAWTAAASPQATFARYAAELGVPEADYRTCTADDQVAPLILQDLGSAISAGVTATPTFIILKGDKVVNQLVGVQPMEEWDAALGEALK